MRFLTPNRLSRAIAIGALSVFAGSASAQTVHPIDMSRPLEPAQFAFLSPVLAGVEVVSLGESIHLTSDFPLIRVGIIRYLNERSDFQMIGMEGSAADIWIAQDRLLASNRSDDDITQALGGLFPIWNTSDVRELLRYETASWPTSHPLYVAAYDIQPGTSKGAPGNEVFRQLAERLGRYADAPPGVDASSLVADLSPLTAACGRYMHQDSTQVEHGISTLASWIERAAPAVDAQFRQIPHAAVLRLIPENLRASHRLCLGRLGEGWSRYKSVRDTNAAQYAVALKAVAPNGKLILWAHLSHVFHDSEGSGVSVGQILHRDLGSRLYTIMPFAEGGFAPLIYSDVNDDLAYGPVFGARGALAKRLSRLSTTDYFLDLRSVATDSLFMTPQSIAVESSTMQLALGRDFDGLIWIKRVHAPHFTDRRMALTLAGLSVVHYRVGALVVVAAIVALVAMRVMARRRRYGSPDIRDL